MLAQELHDRVHTVVLSATDHRAPNLLLRNEARADQPAQMKGERRGRYVETSLDICDVEAGRPGANQEPINVQPGQIAQFGQTTRSEFAIHAFKYSNEEGITTIILVL